MDFTDVVRRRKMIRNYLDRPVDETSLERIVDAARRSPSAGHSQGQSLVVVTDRETRVQIAELSDEQRYVDMGLPRWMSTAPVHIVVCTRPDAYHERYTEPDKLTDEGSEIEWPVPYWWVDAGATMMLVLLAATNEGFSAGVFGSHRLQGLKELLGIPEDVTPIGVVTIGHAASRATTGSATRGRKPAGETVHRQRWGSPGA